MRYGDLLASSILLFTRVRVYTEISPWGIGLGQGLTASFISRPETIVVAGVRDFSGANNKALTALQTGNGSKLIPVKIDSRSEPDAAAAIQEIQSHGIDHLDIVIANAGIDTDYSPVANVPIAAIREHIEVNGYGPLYLFQAALPLLNKSAKPKFIGVGSPLGSIGGMEQRPFPGAAYGPSKAVLHWLVRKVHFEHENFVSFIADPG